MSDQTKQHDEPVKKTRVIVTAPCPPSVSTGYILLRSAVLGVLGAAMQDVEPSLMQPTFIKEDRPSGKFSVNLGKKLGCGELELPEHEQGVKELFDAIEAGCNRLIQENLPITTVTMTKQDIINTYGPGVLDGSHKKNKDGDCLQLASIAGSILCVPPSLPFATTGGIASIQLERGNLCCEIQCGKKARKADIIFKFVVQEHLETADRSVPTLIPISINEALQQPKVRFPEGQILLAKKSISISTPTPTLVPALATTLVKENHAPEESNQDEQEMVVNAFEVKGKIDYDKLVDNFGSKIISDDLLQKLESATVGQGRVPFMHRFLRRGIFFSHRDLQPILEQVEAGKPIYLYTGRGPSSSSMHLGHLVPFLFTQWLQQAFGCPLVIQMTDDEKFLFKGEYNEKTGDNLDYFASLTMENARDIIACGFDYNKTFLFSDLDYVGKMYPNIVRIWKAVTTNAVQGIFGFDGTSNIGKVAFPAIQAAPSFASSFPTVLNADRESEMACLIPCAIDQDPYFRMTRDIAHKLVGKSHKLGGKPALIHSKFFPPLQGAEGKMSSSDDNSAVFLTDTPEQIEKKIKEHAFSGGQESKKLQEEHGADLEIDVSYQWLRFFLEDDKELEMIGNDYKSGSGEFWSTGKVKEKLISILQVLVAEHQVRRAKVTDEEIRLWMTERCIV